MQPQGERQIVIRGQELALHPERAVFWRNQRALILSDLHLGKEQHFRKNGIAVPASVSDADLTRLDTLIQYYKPQQVIFVGDLFHSTYNQSWEQLVIFLSQYPAIGWILIPGNHDILDHDLYEEAGIELTAVQHDIGPFTFTHDNSSNLKTDGYIISGHLHPGVRMKGKGMQAITIPCFLFGADQALLPAFGGFTGLARVAPGAGDRVFSIVEGEVLDPLTPSHC